MVTINMQKTGLKIKATREERKISVRELQAILGLASTQAIYNWQNGLSLPTVDNLVILSDVFGVRMDELLVLN